MSAVEWREHAGARYLHITYGGLTAEEAVTVLEEAAQVVAAEPVGVLALADLRDAVISPTWMSRGKKLAMTVYRPRATRIAFVGLGGLQKQAIAGVHRLGQFRSLTVHDTVDDALAALTNR